MSKKTVLIILGLIMLFPVLMAVISVVVMGFVFSLLPTPSQSKVDLEIVLKDSQGQPIRNSEIGLWKYEYADVVARTDDDGIAKFPAESFHYSKNMYTYWVDRPQKFELRVRVPELSPLYYRFDVVRDGSLEYEVFNSEYDYHFGGEWVGRFNNNQRVKSTIHDMGQEHEAVAPENADRQVQLFSTTAKIQSQKPPNSPFVIRLDLVQTRKWSADEK